MAALAQLAELAGISVHWRDAFGNDHEVPPPTLQAVMRALDIAADTDSQVQDSLRALQDAGNTALPRLVTALAGEKLQRPGLTGRYQIVLESGESLDGTADGSLPAIDRPGYHRLEIAGQEHILAVAPHRCFGVQDAAPGGKLWGLAVQLYGLRRPGDHGIGDFPALASFARQAARQGAAAVAISPVHAQFSADPDRFSPYAPSSRVMCNVLHADPGGPPSTEDEARLEASELMEWPQAARLRLRRMRQVFDALPPAQHAELAQFRAARGDLLEGHARFEALHAHFFGQDHTKWNWRSWDAAFHNPDSAAVRRFAEQHAAEVTFHAWMQFLADSQLQQAQQAARQAGMPIGLVSDLAVGTDAGGSHCWSRQDETLIGLSVGAPPDLLSREGQNWGLTAFSPRGLQQHGYGAFIEMLRAALHHAGGVRIDHAMGLARLWVVPEGAPSSDGAYLRFPFEDMIRLVMLESHRHRAIIMAEDLGTVPEGFQPRLQQAGLLGMRVLWFERDQAQNFTTPQGWSKNAAAMTSTHDLATVAGWWAGRDLQWRTDLNLLGDAANIAREHEARWQDRHRLWNAFRASGSATGDTPMPHDSWPAVEAAARHIGGSACDLAMLPVEDALALEEQPNLPGTMHEHPNWRRRLPEPVDKVLCSEPVQTRLRALDHARKQIRESE